MKRRAQALPGPAVAVTFSRHPLQLLRPEAFQPELIHAGVRAELLLQHGADHVVVLETTRALLGLSARDFFEKIIRDQLRPRVIVEGFNFGFGRNREGTVKTLEDLGRPLKIPLVLGGGGGTSAGVRCRAAASATSY